MLDFISSIATKTGEYFKYRKQRKDNSPLVYTYVFDNQNTKEDYWKKVLQCEYIYFLSSKKDTANEHRSTNNPSLASFKKLSEKECTDILKQDNIFGMIFSNIIGNSMLNIKSITLSDGSFNFIENETILSALCTGESACILSLFSDAPKSFSGLFKDDSITYQIKNIVTGQVYPVFKSEY